MFDSKYLVIYYDIIIDSNRLLNERLNYVKKIMEVAKNADKERIRKQSITYLKKAFHLLFNSKNKEDSLVLSSVKESLEELGVTLKSLDITVQKKQQEWYEEEVTSQHKKASRLITSPDWDIKVYGRWIHESPSMIEQFKFFSDTSFELIKRKVISSDRDIYKNLQPEVLRGNYDISKSRKTLKLIFNKKISHVYKYYIDGGTLFFDHKEFHKISED